jgi:hypothetical protein
MRAWSQIGVGCACLAFLVVAAGCVDRNTARGEVLAEGRVCEDDAGIVDGLPDYGVTYKFAVRNAGDAGFITIAVTVSTSEGEWKREQKMQFAAGETQKLSYFFAEPTLNATNIQCRVSLSPSK